MKRVLSYLSIAVLLAGLHQNARGIGGSESDATDTVITSGNPIITHIRSADPAAKVWNDGQVWVYASHDQDDATDYSKLDGYHVFSSYDLVHWTDHGEILHSRDVSWGNPDGGWMFAPDAAYRDGTYYFYFPHLSSEWKWRVGVATSHVPEGPFTDVGHFIEGTDNIDPACFMDDDGQAYLLWGGDGETPRIARLKENMTELAEEPRPIDYGADNFGEGGTMHKHNGIYYFSYTCNTCWPDQGFYAMGDNPYGPFEYKGPVNHAPPGAQDHHSIIEYHGQSYYFYHVGNYGTEGSIYRRNICVDSLYYNEDGTMRMVNQTTAGVGIDLIGMTPGKVIPGRFEAEDYFRQQGVTTMQTGDPEVMVTEIENGDWFDYVLDILGTESYQAQLNITDGIPGTTIYLLVDEILSDSVLIEEAGDTITTPLYLHKGKHTFKLLFSNPDTTAELAKVDWIGVTGETEYFYVETIMEEGGSCDPPGTSYYARGDSAVFRLEAGFNYVLDSVWIDGILQELSDQYTFYNLSENHTLTAGFTACSAISGTPFYRINGEPQTEGTEVAITEGNDLILRVEHDSTSTLSWTGPGVSESTDSVLMMSNINVSEGGIYTAYLTNDQGCITEFAFQVSVAYVELDVYEAEQFFNQSGIVLETCHDLGGGKYVGYINNHDYCYYSLSIPEAGIYEITSRVATGGEGGSIGISSRDSLIAAINVDGSMSGGWEDWITTDPVEVGFEKGVQILKFTFSGGEGNLFNFNWFDLAFSRPFDTDTATSTRTGITVHAYPNPFVSGINIVYTLEEESEIELQLWNISGSLVRTLVPQRVQSRGTYTVRWDAISGKKVPLSTGMYILRLRSDKGVIIRKIILNRSD